MSNGIRVKNVSVRCSFKKHQGRRAPFDRADIYPVILSVCTKSSYRDFQSWCWLCTCSFTFSSLSELPRACVFQKTKPDKQTNKQTYGLWCILWYKYFGIRSLISHVPCTAFLFSLLKQNQVSFLKCWMSFDNTALAVNIVWRRAYF